MPKLKSRWIKITKTYYNGGSTLRMKHPPIVAARVLSNFKADTAIALAGVPTETGYAVYSGLGRGRVRVEPLEVIA